MHFPFTKVGTSPKPLRGHKKLKFLVQQPHYHVAHVLCAMDPTKPHPALLPYCSSSKPSERQIDQSGQARQDCFLGQRMHMKEWRKRPRKARNCVGNIDEEEEVVKVSPLWNMPPLSLPPLQEHNKSAGVLGERWAQHLKAGPGPIGLSLTISASLVNMIQEQLDQDARAKGRYTASDAYGGVSDTRSITKPTLKPSKFHAYILRIGAWKWKSRYDGDIVAKFYYTNSKLVWEILDEGLKCKIEIDWSHISALKVTCPEGGPGTMEILLSRRPRFSRETNQQPGRNTSWQETIDFTGGQASMHRRHVLRCAPGILNKHIVKLLSSNHRLYSLSQENTIDQENPWFEPWHSESEIPESSNAQDLYRPYDYHQFGGHQFGEQVPMSIGTNVVGRNFNGSQDGVPIHIPSSVPAHAAVSTGAPSGGLQLQRDAFICNNSSLQTPHQAQPNISSVPRCSSSVATGAPSGGLQHQQHRNMFNCNNPSFQTCSQAPLNISSGRIMNGTANLIDPRNQRHLLTPSNSLIQPDIPKNCPVSSWIPSTYSNGPSNQMTREMESTKFSLNNTTQTFNQTNSANWLSNDNAAMALAKISHCRLSNTNTTEPTLGRSSVATGAPTGGLQQHRNMFNSSNASLQTRPQTQLNISGGSTMNDTASYMINPSKRRNLLSGVDAASDGLIRPENVRKFVNDIRSAKRPASPRIPPIFSDGASSRSMRELELNHGAFNSTSQTFEQINAAALPGNDDAATAAMVLEKVSHDLFDDDGGVEPAGADEEAAIMSRVNSLSNLLQQDQDPDPITAQSSQQASYGGHAAAAAPPLANVSAEAATQVLDVAPAGSCGGACSGGNLLPSTGMEAAGVPWEQEPVVDIEMDLEHLSGLLPFWP